MGTEWVPRSLCDTLLVSHQGRGETKKNRKKRKKRSCRVGQGERGRGKWARRRENEHTRAGQTKQFAIHGQEHQHLHRQSHIVHQRACLCTRGDEQLFIHSHQQHTLPSLFASLSPLHRYDATKARFFDSISAAEGRGPRRRNTTEASKCWY